MKLSIYSLKKTLYDGDAKLINCQTEAGEITILDGHRPMVSMLKSGAMKIVDVDNGEKEHFINIKSGFLEIKLNNEVRFIVEE